MSVEHTPDTGDCIPVHELHVWIDGRQTVLAAERMTTDEILASDSALDRAKARLEGLKYDGQMLELTALRKFLDTHKQ